MRVLVVDDNPANVRLATAVLAIDGHFVVSAETAALGIAALEGRPLPDAVLLDINIPGGGLSVLRHVRASPDLADLAVIAFTALAMHGDRERFLAAGCDAYISKPIDIRSFTPQIEAAIRGRRARASVGGASDPDALPSPPR